MREPVKMHEVQDLLDRWIAEHDSMDHFELKYITAGGEVTIAFRRPRLPAENGCVAKE